VSDPDLEMQKSNPAIFHAPLLLKMMDSGHTFPCIILALPCKNAKASDN